MPGFLAACAGLGLSTAAVPAFAASFTTLYTFTPAKDGNAPQSEMTQGTDGKLYGTNSLGGPNNTGSLFRINTDGGSFTGISFFGPTTTGLTPNGGVIQGTDGYFYGTTYGGGDNGLGLIYKIQTAGQLVKLASFATGDPGSSPAATLTQGIDGYFYGTAQLGGLNNYGTIFRTDPATGKTTTVSPFSGGTDGLYPESELTQAADGNFYGTTINGGAANAGTIFQVTPGGVRTTIYAFKNTTDGNTPLRGVVPGRDGFLYGVAVKGGASLGGTIFRVSTAGDFTLLYSFTGQLGAGSPYSSEGRLVQAGDGNFYGTTNLGGTFNDGTIFKVTPTGGFTTLYNFTNGADGGYPVAGLTQGEDGNLYGTTSGQNGTTAGTVFRLDLDLPLPTPLPLLFTPSTVSEGDTLTIKGDDFLGVTGVVFPTASGSAAAGFTVLSKTVLQAVVPTGAVSGVVTLQNGTLLAATPAALTVNVPVVVTPPPDPEPGNPPTGSTSPEVTIVAVGPVAVEGSTNTGKFKVKRSGGDLSLPLPVVFKGKGSAVRGERYVLYVGGEALATVTNSVTIPAGMKKVSVIVQALDDQVAEPEQTVTMKLKPGANYTVGTLNKATVIVADNS